TRRDKDLQPQGGWRPEECLTPEEALGGFTTWAAYAAFAEDQTGVLAPGCLADITVMDVDPLVAGSVTPEKLLKASIKTTFVGGGRGAGLRAQMLMLAATCLLFFPALGAVHFFGQAVRGSVSPVGISVVVGAFLFGVGMQLGGGCASGTLYTAGGGNTRMLVTLAAFIAGSVVGVAHMPWWEKLPALKPISLVGTLGVVPALAV